MTRNMANLTRGQAPCETTLRPQVRECTDSLSVRRLRTVSPTPSDCQSDAFGLRSLRYAAILILMMFLGVNTAWGQLPTPTTDDDITYGKSTDTTYGKSEDTTYGHNIEREYKNEKDQEGGIDEVITSRHGNVGTVSVEKLINEELDLLSHFDVYSWIAGQFENDNMIMLY